MFIYNLISLPSLPVYCCFVYNYNQAIKISKHFKLVCFCIIYAPLWGTPKFQSFEHLHSIADSCLSSDGLCSLQINHDVSSRPEPSEHFYFTENPTQFALLCVNSGILCLGCVMLLPVRNILACE